MAMIDCPECGTQISDKAESCPHCGYILRSLQNEDEISNGELSANTGIDPKQRRLSKKSMYILFGAVAICACVCIFFYLRANPPLSDADKETYAKANRAYENSEYLLAYSLYAKLPNYSKAVKKMDSIKMPLKGTWIFDTNISLSYITFYFQYYFNEDDPIYLVMTASSTPLLSKEAFVSSGKVSSFTFDSISGNSDGTLSLSYKNSDEQLITFKIIVNSNDSMTMITTGRTFEYQRTGKLENS